MIRLATNGDVPEIVRLGSLSLVDGPYKGLIADNPEQSAKFALQVIHGLGKILLWEEGERISGLFGMLIIKHPFSDELVATEVMWYVEVEARKTGAGVKLLWEAEKIAKELGALYLQIAAPNLEIAAIYERFGYQKVDVNYFKRLGGESSSSQQR